MGTHTCGQCGHNNDDTRVFCQNCGARLEVESVAPAARNLAAPARRNATARKAPRGGGVALLGALVREVFFTAILAVILAALIQAVRMPDDVPPALPAVPSSASFLAADIQAARDSIYPRSLNIDADAANNYLAARVMGADTGGSLFRAQMVRAYIVPGVNAFTLGVEQNLSGHPIHLRLVYSVESQDGGTAAVLTGGSMGRLPVPKFLVPLYSRSFAGVLEALSHPASWFATASTVKIEPSGAFVRWPGSGAP